MKEDKGDSKTGLPGFLKYRGNNLSGKEKNSFEKEIQKDPFALEAEEGLSSLSDDELMNDIRDLENRIRSRTKRNNRRIYYAIAASFALLLTLSVVFLTVNRFTGKAGLTGKGNVAALTEKKEESQAKTDAGFHSKEEVANKRQTEKENKTEVTGISGNIESRPAAQEKKDNILPPVAVNSDKAERQENPSPQSHIEKDLTGAVGGVPGEQIKAKDQAVITADLVADNKIKKATIDSAMNIFPDSDNQALSEVVVTGYDAKRKSGEISTRSAVKVDMNGAGGNYTYAEPVGGKDKFDEYVRLNQKMPAEFKPGNKVTVVLSFIVDKSGSPYKIKVIRSPSDPFSEEAIRLLKEGPEWKPATRNGNPVYDETRLKIIFR